MSPKICFRDEIPTILSQCRSVEEFQKAIDPGGHLWPKLFEQFAEAAGEVRFAVWASFMKRLLVEDITGEFLNYRYWKALAADPRKFDRELQKRLARIKSRMKKLYGIQAHRKVSNLDRDERLWMAKQQNPDMTFGEIAHKFKLTPNVAERAVKRQEARKKEDLKMLLDFVADLIDLAESSNSRATKTPTT